MVAVEAPSPAEKRETYGEGVLNYKYA